MKKTEDIILLVEPDEFLADIYEKNLLLEGFQVLRTVNPERIIKLAISKKPQAIILEISLPFGNGFEILKDLKENKITENIPIIVLTKLGGKDEMKKVQQYRITDFLVKQHFRPAEVVDKLKNILAK